jgi:hypothetical protein
MMEETEIEGSTESTKRSFMSLQSAEKLLEQCDDEIKEAWHDLTDAKELAERAGLWTESSILDPTFPDASKNLVVLRTTGGHSNTDHVVTLTGDARTDRIAELKRAMQRRARALQPEKKGEDRWDKPRIAGERRRRILREKDMPGAPPEPPPSGYAAFVFQMTTKIRHDRPLEPHNQVKVVKEIGKIWKYGMSEEDREYYNEFARQAREEYQEQHREYRATGQYTPSTTFKKLDGTGPWVRVATHDKNGLEREIETYDTVQFPPRPPEMDDAYRLREQESKRRRKERIKVLDDDRKRQTSLQLHARSKKYETK